MQLSDKAIAEFEKLWLEDHPDLKLTKNELALIAERVFKAAELVYGNMKPDNKI
jgi:hypothetical protein